MASLFLSLLFIGIICGMVSVPIIYFLKKRKRHGKKHGFRGAVQNDRLKADTSVLEVLKKEHSAEKF